MIKIFAIYLLVLIEPQATTQLGKAEDALNCAAAMGYSAKTLHLQGGKYSTVQQLDDNMFVMEVELKGSKGVLVCQKQVI